MKYIHYWLGDNETEYDDIVVFDDNVSNDEIILFITESLNDWSIEHYYGSDDQDEWEDYLAETWYDWEEVSKEDAEFIRHFNMDKIYSQMKISD